MHPTASEPCRGEFVDHRPTNVGFCAFTERRVRISRTTPALFRPDDELAVHHPVPRFTREVAVERKGPGTVSAELERCRAAGGDPLDDSILVDGKAVRDVLAPQRELDEVILHH